MPKTKTVIVVFSFCLILSHVWCFGIHIKMDKQKNAGTSRNPLCDKLKTLQHRNSGHPKLKGDPLGYGERLLQRMVSGSLQAVSSTKRGSKRDCLNVLRRGHLSEKSCSLLFEHS